MKYIVRLFLSFCMVFLLYLSGWADSPKRIISLGPFITESLYLLGADENVIGVTTFCIRPPEAQDKEKIGTVTGVSTEKVISLNPDIVLATSLSDRRAVEKLRRLGIKVIKFPMPKNFSELSEHFMKLGEITGRQRQASKILKKAQERIDAVQSRISRLPKPKVFIQVGARPLFTMTGDSFVNDLIKLGGGINIAADAKIGFYSRERVIEQNPDVIIIMTMGIVGEEEKRIWQKYKTINAVKNNRIHIMDSYKIGSPTPLTFAETVEEMAELFHLSAIARQFDSATVNYETLTSLRLTKGHENIIFPLWKRGMKGDFKINEFVKSLLIPLCQRGVFSEQINFSLKAVALSHY